jgi:hypothetical protein
MELKTFLETQGYLHLREIPGKGWCGITRMLYTWGLFYGMTAENREGRYCFDSLTEAKAALSEWDGTGDPPGDWIKHFGDQEYTNPEMPPVFNVQHGRITDDQKFGIWLAELHYITANETGQPPALIKINAGEARKWFNDGYTPYYCFRETWGMENDSAV